MPAATAPLLRSPAADVSATVGAGILWAAVLFNLLLCFADTNLLRLSAAPVMLVEGAILGAALLLPLARSRRGPNRMDFLLIGLFGTWLLLSILRQVIDPKYFRDVAIIPIFVLLGLATRGEGLHRRLFWLHMVIVAFAVWEAISVTNFVSVFSIGDYFAHTRGKANIDWSVESGLYLSAIRPEARFLFPALPLHRLSSVFLEPVSLGNYVVIATIWVAGFWRQIPQRMRMVAAVTTLLLLIGSDSRMATVTCIALLLALPARRFIPALAPVLVAPLVIAAMVLAVLALHLQAGTDDFGGRIGHAVETFRAFTLSNYAGLSLSLLSDAEDAGFAYIVMTQSLLMAVALWVSLFLRRLRTPESRYVHLAVALYVALNLTVSWSLFSIKTAGLLWFLLGKSLRDDAESADSAGPGAPPRELRAEPRPPATPGAPGAQRLGWLSNSA